MPLHIGKIIKEVAKKKGISQATLARRINTTPQNIQSISKRQTIDTGMLQKISEVLNHDFFQYYRHGLELRENKNESQVDEAETIYQLLSLSLEKLGRLKKSLPKGK